MATIYQKTINGEVIRKRASQIVIRRGKMQIINPPEEMILADGWTVYVPPTPEPAPYIPTEEDIVVKLIKQEFNARTDVGNEDALNYMLIVYPFEDYIGKSLKAGQLVTYDERVWRVRQDITTVIEEYFPSTDTASLYEVIEKEHSGEVDDPIPYTPPMEIFEGKYYTQDDVKYLCTRDSGTALSHNLADLVGLYVEVVE